MECDQKIKPMSNPIANPWAALQDKWIAQESSRMDELSALRRKVAAADRIVEAADMCVCCCPGHCPLDAALAAWNEENQS